MLRKARPLIICSALLLILTISRIVLYESNYLRGSIQAFAVDSNEQVYVGLEDKIIVFDGKENISIVCQKISQRYAFVIMDDKLIIGYKEQELSKEYSLQGEYLGESDLSYKELRSISKGTRESTVNGKTYQLKNYYDMKPAEIVSDGKVIYKESVLDFVFGGPLYHAIEFGMVIFASFLLVIFVTDREVSEYLKSLKY